VRLKKTRLKMSKHKKARESMDLTPKGLYVNTNRIKHLLIILEIAALLQASEITEEGNLFF
jgi:hypothetical protein